MSEYKITDNDIKALKFRDELIELLNKYNYELSGYCLDDGDIEICSLNEGGGQYIKKTMAIIHCMIMIRIKI